ncbi:MAG: cell division protein ZapA [Myxococcota bacterium]|nr:cell division protein ZapA [Myxococcota bacterium]
MKTSRITVAGRTFQIRSDADEQYLNNLSKIVTERFHVIRKSGARPDQDFKAMAMVAIGLLDELTASNKRYQSMREGASRFATHMIKKIDELLANASK